ncbi:MAG: hypothetical protein ACHQHN_06885 [Sphingobacteriales bacterium]
MKSIALIAVVVLFIAGFSSCKLDTMKPTKITSGPLDTNFTLITDTTLVGKWTIVTDSISYQGTNTMYKGTASDHYTFTKWGNLFINEGLNSLVDTAVYNISIENSQSGVSWINSYISVNGNATREQSVSSLYAITSVSTTSLILTANIQTIQGPRYEQIKLKK